MIIKPRLTCILSADLIWFGCPSHHSISQIIIIVLTVILTLGRQTDFILSLQLRLEKNR